MDAERVVAAMRRHVLRPSERIERRWDHPGSVALRTRRHDYRAQRSGWAIGGEPWVDEALRVVADSWNEHGTSPAYGLILPRDGDAIFLNDVAAMRRLGRRLGDGLDPVAYAELLAELHYPREQADHAVVRPSRPGRLIRDPGEFREHYPFADPALPRAPEVRDVDDGRVLGFRSYDHYTLAVGSALDVYDWTVTAPHGEPPDWSCDIVAQRLETPAGTPRPRR